MLGLNTTLLFGIIFQQMDKVIATIGSRYFKSKNNTQFPTEN